MEPFSFTVASIFGNHMVLQRNKPLKVWGESNKPQKIAVFIDGSQAASTQAAAGAWMMTLPALETSRNLLLKITGENESEAFTFHDVAVGEVWIAGGQSNMEFPLEYDAEAKNVIPAACSPDIRFFDCPKIKFEGQEKEDDFSTSGFWRPLDPANAPYYSAVGFYFASQISENYQVPVGIVGCNWGGTTASTWLDERYLQEDEALSIYCQEYQENLKNLDLEAYIAAEKKGRELIQQPPAQNLLRYIMKHTPGPLLYPILTRLLQPTFKNLPQPGPRDMNRPGGLYHTMVQKIAGYPARGVLWYQGESDDPKADLYSRLFTALIRCWREAWGENLPFLYVQLAPFERWLGMPAVNYPTLREQQEIVSKTVPGVFMASIMDAGSKLDIHPKNKRPVGERLALLAQGKVYGEGILCEAPEVLSAKMENGRLAITFIHAGTGLRLKGGHLKSLELFADGKEIKNPKVSIAQDTVMAQAEGLQTAKELEVLFAFHNFAEINLYNSANLPAKPFRRTVKPCG